MGELVSLKQFRDDRSAQEAEKKIVDVSIARREYIVKKLHEGSSTINNLANAIRSDKTKDMSDMQRRNLAHSLGQIARDAARELGFELTIEDRGVTFSTMSSHSGPGVFVKELRDKT